MAKTCQKVASVRSRGSAGIFVLVPYVPFYVFFHWFVGQPGGFLSFLPPGSGGQASAHAATLLASADAVTLLFVRLWTWGKRETRERARWLTVGWLTGALLLVWAGSAYFGKFADDVYPNVQQEWGGGRASEVQLLFKPGALNELRSSKPLSQVNLTSPISVLYESSEFYVVKISAGHALVLDKDLVLGVVVPYAPP